MRVSCPTLGTLCDKAEQGMTRSEDGELIVVTLHATGVLCLRYPKEGGGYLFV